MLYIPLKLNIIFLHFCFNLKNDICFNLFACVFFINKILNIYVFFLMFLLVTPLDVVKIRLQTQQKAMLSNKCFLYCNGLMDHLCPCTNGKMPDWMKRNGKFKGTFVRNYYIIVTFNISEYYS